MPMPSGDEIHGSLRAAGSLMLGRRDALRGLDLSADGFWNSFFAFVVALPALFVFWTSEAIQTAPGSSGERIGIVIRLAVIEIVAWVAPLLAIAWLLYRLGHRDRFTAFVVANNWGSALLAWFILPVTLLMTLVPGLAQLAMILFLFVFIAMLVFTWRLNDSVMNAGPIMPTGILLALVGLSLFIDYILRMLLAMPSIDQAV